MVDVLGVKTCKREAKCKVSKNFNRFELSIPIICFQILDTNVDLKYNYGQAS